MYLVMFHKNWKSFLRNIAVTSLAEVWIETGTENSGSAATVVTSLAEVWIETCGIGSNPNDSLVTSLAEVWIET